MAPNPDPTRITAELWLFIQHCKALEPDDTGDLYPYADKPGSHNSRRRLIARGLTNDYSIRDPLNQQGPDWACAAFDWISKNAQRGDRRIMNKYGRRVRDAYNRRDPRLFGVFEILTQVDAGVPEGYVCYPTRHTRTPDDSHDWHHHIGILRKYLQHWPAFAGLLSVLAGEALNDWLAGKSQYQQGGDMELSGESRRWLEICVQYVAAQLVDGEVVTGIELAGRPKQPYPNHARNRISALATAAVASAQREQAMLAAIAALAQGGGNIDVGVILTRIDARTADVTGLIADQAAEIDRLQTLVGELRGARAAAASAESDALDGQSRGGADPD